MLGRKMRHILFGTKHHQRKSLHMLHTHQFAILMRIVAALAAALAGGGDYTIRSSAGGSNNRV